MSLIAEILGGSHDNSLRDIISAARQRTKLVEASNTAVKMFDLKVGDKVRLKDLSPKYMNGVECVITGKKRTKFEVKLDQPVGRFSGTGLTVPASCVEKV